MQIRENLEKREAEILSPCACHSTDSKGRDRAEEECDIRPVFQRDRDRILHSKSFRRLKDKTQVFLTPEGDHYRTRLTHTLEVSQNARTIARALRLNEDLVEAIALGHDLGHTPFGHAGERGLNKAMTAFGGFDHNVNSLRIMTELEVHYPNFNGLNLTWETLEGTVKHNGPIKKIQSNFLKEYNKKFDLDLKRFSSLESQIASFADDIAYNNHDIDDGFRAGFFSIEQLCELPFIAKIIVKFDKEYPHADDNLRIYAITRTLIADMVFDLLSNTQLNIIHNKIETAEDVRRHSTFTADFSAEMHNNINQLHNFLKKYFYTHTNVARMDMKSQRIVEDLFAAFMSDEKLLPMSVRYTLPANADTNKLAETICTYIANMTDLKAIEEHQKLFDILSRF